MASEVPAGHLEPWKELPDKVVLVTGASSGLGEELCIDLAKAGCRIIAAARRVDRLLKLCHNINQLPTSLTTTTSSSSSSSSFSNNNNNNNEQQPRAVAVELDVSADGPTIERCIQTAWDAFGKIDVLINNAGVTAKVKAAIDLPEEEWNRVIRTNLTGSWLVSKYVCRRMRDAKLGGSVINISSIAGLQRGHLPGGVAYAASKVALNTMTKMMALELGEHKIRVNSIAPGLLKSEITEGLMQKSWINKIASRTVPLRTFGTSDPALTTLVRYLIHDSSEYVTGNMFIADAGTSLAGIPIFSSL